MRRGISEWKHQTPDGEAERHDDGHFSFGGLDYQEAGQNPWLTRSCWSL